MSTKHVSKHISKYLQQYAEAEVQALLSFPDNFYFKQAVIVPAFKESSNFVDDFFASPLANEQALVILIINQPDSIKDTIAQQALFDKLHQRGELVWQADNLSLLNYPHNSVENVSVKSSTSKLLVVNRFTQAIPEKQGVGLARKIGADIALSLFHRGYITSPWLYSTDADVKLPDNYFSALASHSYSNDKNSEGKTVAACFNFSHASDNIDIHQANQQYEQALRYYVAGLNYAGSHYAFFTIGSTLAINVQAYATVRGFPKRSAGEDFYLLNKVAKLGDIAFIESSKIAIKARTSDRVPFGTGPAVSQIIVLNKSQQDYCYYHPQVFELLKQCLSAFEQLWLHREQLDLWYAKLDEAIVNALDAIAFNRFLEKNSNHHQQQFDKQLQVWFDGFKTLKFIHALRDFGYANIPLTQALNQAEFT